MAAAASKPHRPATNNYDKLSKKLCAHIQQTINACRYECKRPLGGGAGLTCAFLRGDVYQPTHTKASRTCSTPITSTAIYAPQRLPELAAHGAPVRSRPPPPDNVQGFPTPAPCAAPAARRKDPWGSKDSDVTFEGIVFQQPPPRPHGPARAHAAGQDPDPRASFRGFSIMSS